jgi:Phage integrase, N-terminal SAM-like domain
LLSRELGSSALTDELALEFVAARRVSYYNLRSPRGMAPLLGYLREIGAAPEPVAPRAAAPGADLLISFHRYLAVERRLVAGTVDNYVQLVRRFLDFCAGQGVSDLAEVRADRVSGFVLSECTRRPSGSARHAVTPLRALLRFGQLSGLTTAALVLAVPRAVNRRGAGLPRSLAPRGVARPLASCDRRTRRGRRLDQPGLRAVPDRQERLSTWIASPGGAISRQRPTARMIGRVVRVDDARATTLSPGVAGDFPRPGHLDDRDAVCRRVCMVICFPCSEGQFAAARATWWARRRSIASRLRRAPVMVVNSGSLGAPGRSVSQPLRTARVGGTSGVRRSSLPLPMVCTLAPTVSVTSWRLSPASSEIRSPAWMVSVKHGVIAPAGPGVQVAGLEQRVHLGVGEVGDEVALGALGWDGEHAREMSNPSAPDGRSVRCSMVPCASSRLSLGLEDPALTTRTRTDQSRLAALVTDGQVQSVMAGSSSPC